MVYLFCLEMVWGESGEGRMGLVEQGASDLLSVDREMCA